ncbi:hypothetical protein KEJ37_01275 [Candidatus Bathyarchaeota archaeon]|nr:hypothetical protein [Candidatus Bathyarchaeota archaeon]
MKFVKRGLFEETMKILAEHAYKIRYVPHEIIEDYNATYNVVFRGKIYYNKCCQEVKVPLNDIRISEMWRTYEKYIIFHELREIEIYIIEQTDSEETKRTKRLRKTGFIYGVKTFYSIK